MKKITLMYDFFSEYGGIERTMIFQARALRKRGYKINFAFAYVDEKLKNSLLKDFEVIEYGSLLLRNETLQICSSFLRDEPLKKLTDSDLIICHSFPASYFAYRLHKKYKIPYLQIIHHLPQFLYNSNLGWANNTLKRRVAFSVGKIFSGYLKNKDKMCVLNATKILANSKMVKNAVKKIYGLDVEIYYSNVNDIFFARNKNKEKVSKKYGLPKEFLFGSGRIIYQKRFDFLIEAASKLKSKKLPVVLAGTYDKKNKIDLEKYADKLDVKLIFLGQVGIEELKDIYSLAKVTVLTCPKEYFGLVPIEAAASGCPVVAWNDGAGPSETVKEGIGGLLAKPYDTNDMARKIDIVLGRKWNKKKISDSVRRFSEKVISGEFAKVIEKLI